MCSGLGWSNDQHVCLHVCRPHDYMACRVCGHMCLERCARSGVPPLAKPICGFFAATRCISAVFSFPCPQPAPAPSEQMASVAYCKQISAPCVRALWAPFVQTYRVTSHEYVCVVGMDITSEHAFLLGRHLPLDPVWTERIIRLSRYGFVDPP